MRTLSWLCSILILALSLPAQAAQSVTQLDAEAEVLDIAWLDSETLVILQRKDGLLGIGILDSQNGELNWPELPRGLARAGEEPELYQLSLAPLGNALAVVERDESPVSASRLSAYTISRDEVLAVATYRLPMEFWPGAVCWDEAGANLFVAVRPFLQPQQPVSLTMFRLATAEFVPLLKRSRLDIIRQLEFLPGSGELAILCASYEGDYPSEDIVVLLNPDGNRTSIAHGQAGDAEMALMDNGDLLLHREIPGGVQDWILPAGEQQFRMLSGEGVPGWGCQASRDSSWLASLRSTAAGPELVIQDGKGRALTSGLDCSIWRFNHDGSRLACIERGSGLLHVLEPPQP